MTPSARLTLIAILALTASFVEALPAQSPTIGTLFDDVTEAAGVTFVHASGATPEKRMIESFGSGAAWIDADGDGWQDLFLVSGAPGSSNALYHNRGDGTFVDVTSRSGLGGTTRTYRTGVAVGDIDNDGDLDLYVTGLGRNTLYRNDGHGVFNDITAAAGVGGSATDWSTSTGFFDADGDGDLDLYVVNYLDVGSEPEPYCGLMREGYRRYCGPGLFDGTPDRLFRNNGNGTFTDVSTKAGIGNPAGKGLGVAFCDVDLDGNVDIYVANDMVRNFLYKNRGDGTFEDITYRAGVGFDATGTPQAGMGTDCADVDGNGLPDLFVTDYEDELNGLYLNRGGGLFEDASATGGLRAGLLPLAWGTRLFDVDNDGDRDIYVVNGHFLDNIELYNPGRTHGQRDLLFENVGGGRFVNVSDRGGPAMALARVGRGLATADYDNDGDLDLVLTGVGEAPVVLRNRGVPGRSWVTLRLRGRASNRFGVGARVTIEAGGVRQVGEVGGAGSYQSASDLRLHFGLGAASTVDRIDIRWPGGTTQVIEHVAANRVVEVREP